MHIVKQEMFVASKTCKKELRLNEVDLRCVETVGHFNKSDLVCSSIHFRNCLVQLPELLGDTWSILVPYYSFLSNRVHTTASRLFFHRGHRKPKVKGLLEIVPSSSRTAWLG